jgi:hypothetical protein
MTAAELRARIEAARAAGLPALELTPEEWHQALLVKEDDRWVVTADYGHGQADEGTTAYGFPLVVLYGSGRRRVLGRGLAELLPEAAGDPAPHRCRAGTGSF